MNENKNKIESNTVVRQPRLAMVVCACMVFTSWLIAGCGPTDRNTDARAEALAHYQAGSVFIMDEGRWTRAEAEFRAAMAADPDWVLGRAAVGRITSDVTERESLLAWIEPRLDNVQPDVRLLLDVSVLSLKTANARDRKVVLATGFREQHQTVAITNFRRYLQNHPEDPYVSAELVEWINEFQGAEAALEVLETEIHPDAARVPFCLGFRATLLSELGRHEEALKAAEVFEAELDDVDAPALHVVYAQMFLDMGRNEEAANRIETAVALDAKNLSAKRLHEKIKARR